MAKILINARINKELKQAAAMEAKKRGVTLSKIVESGLIHELNRHDNGGTIYELKKIQALINKRITELEPEETEQDIKTDKEYIKELEQIQKTRKYISEGILNKYSIEMGLTVPELLELLKNNNIDILIM